MSKYIRVPTDKRFITELAFRMCMEAGDSWAYDDGAQDQWGSTALETVKNINKLLRWQKRAAHTQMMRGR